MTPVPLPSGNCADCRPLDLVDYLEAEGRLGACAARAAGFPTDEVAEWMDEGDQRYVVMWAARELPEDDATELAYLVLSLRIVPSLYLHIEDPVAAFLIDKKVAETAGKLRAEAESSGDEEASSTRDVGYGTDPDDE